MELSQGKLEKREDGIYHVDYVTPYGAGEPRKLNAENEARAKQLYEKVHSQKEQVASRLNDFDNKIAELQEQRDAEEQNLSKYDADLAFYSNVFEESEHPVEDEEEPEEDSEDIPQV